MVELLVGVSILICGTVLYLLYHIYIFSMIWAPGLDAVFNMWSDLCFIHVKRSIIIYLNERLIVVRLCIALTYAFWHCTLGLKVEVIQTEV